MIGFAPFLHFRRARPLPSLRFRPGPSGQRCRAPDDQAICHLQRLATRSLRPRPVSFLPVSLWFALSEPSAGVCSIARNSLGIRRGHRARTRSLRHDSPIPKELDRLWFHHCSQSPERHSEAVLGAHWLKAGGYWATESRQMRLEAIHGRILNFSLFDTLKGSQPTLGPG